MRQIIWFLSLGMLLFSCQNDTVQEEPSTNEYIPMTSRTDFGQTRDGIVIEKYQVTNKNGMRFSAIPLGATITELMVPDKTGKLVDVVLGFDSVEDYETKSPYFGAVVGRYGNRIRSGVFEMDGQKYELEKNNGLNHLHGGIKGFDKVVWSASAAQRGEDKGVIFTYISIDGEGGYPGNLTIWVTYILTQDNILEVSYRAVTDKPTIINPTQHTYFNLSGDFSKDILDHELTINAEYYIPVDSTLIPFGDLKSVNKTPFDFTKAKKIGKDIRVKHEQLVFGKGYDHCWALKNDSTDWAATLSYPGTGIKMEVYTTEPGIQFYSGNFLDGTLPAKGGGTYPFRGGLCLETQHFPDSPNQPLFPSTVLRPNEIFESKTRFVFK
jgi:aldose 1-epimerase